ncbi:MAG: MCE family protein [Deltaproteobacteria bacterium]|nr:MCE family protein [Deltaproteobacteria bacterium]
MRSISTEAKVGLFILIALIILGYMSFQVGEYGFGLKKGYIVTAVFDNVTGLERDAAVQIAGVEVGKVEKISLVDGKALVELRILPNVQVEKDATISIKTHGILGDKYVDIVPGETKGSYIAERGQFQNVEKQADIDKLLVELGNIAEDIRVVTGALRKVVGGDAGESNLSAIITNVKELTANLNSVVKANDRKFTVLVDNLTSASKQMEQTFASLSEITGKVNQGEGTLGQLVTNKGVFEKLDNTLASIQTITEKINTGEGTLGQLVTNKGVFEKMDNTLASIQTITDKINAGQGTIGKLVNDEETVTNLNSSLKSIDKSMVGINRFVSKADQFRTFLGYRGEYFFEKSDGKSYIDVTIQPKEDKFYILGLVSDPRGRRKTYDRITDGVTVRTEEWDRNGLLFNAQIGKRFNDLLLRGGLLESTGGFGVDFFAMRDNLKLTFEAFDFDLDRDPHMKVFGEYQILKHLYLTAGWDDFLNRDNDSLFAGFAIRFEDEDLKYLLTSAPIPK